MLRSIVIALLLTGLAMGSGYLLGRDLGRADLAQECATTGIFILQDSESGDHRSYHCFEIGEEPASHPAPPKHEGIRS